MPAGQRPAAHRGALALVMGLGALFGVLFGVHDARATEPACALAVTVEGVPQGAALGERLTAIARREGACSARTWALRVAPGPKGTYVVALWNGAELETRFATQAEVEPVASVLLRVALERQGQAAAAPTASSSASADPAASSGALPSDPPALTPPASGASASPEALSASGFSIGPELGAVGSNAGFGGELGLLGFAHGRHVGGGLFGRYGLQGRATQSRSAFEAGALGALGAPLGRSVWLAGVFELGLSLQRAAGEADGSTASVSASGATVGGGVMALLRPSPHLFLGARLMGRWSSPSAQANDVTATTSKKPGNGNGNGQGQGRGGGASKTVTTVEVDPASQHAVNALGGAAVSLAFSVGYAF